MADQAHLNKRPARPRAQRATVNPEALVVAARDLFAEAGPSAVSIRAVAERAGCSHTLVGRHFGSKAGLEAAVIDRLATGLSVLTTRQCSSDDWPMSVLVEVFRFHPEAGKLLVRCALGEFDPAPLFPGHNIAECLAGHLERRRGGDPDQPGTQATLAAYGALSLYMGLVAFEPLLLAGARLDDVPREQWDAFMAQAAESVAALAVEGETFLAYGPEPHVTSSNEPADLTSLDSRTALVHATIDLYSRTGPATLTTREIADRAQVNQGLIYHYFESREHLFAEAIETANNVIVTALDASGPLDLVMATRARLESRGLPLMARLMVNGIDIRTVRRTHPVFDRMLAEVADHHDPVRARLSVATALAFSAGSVLFDDMLRSMLRIPGDADLLPVTAALTEHLLYRAR
jgi:AcrR family transcriptional regulator